MLENLATGFGIALSLHNLVMILVGTVMGLFVGAMPGLSPTVGLAIVLPFTFGLEPSTAMVMMVSLYMAAEYGGSITAIALGVPGTAAALATTFDGHQMGLRGESERALGISLVASTIGGLLSTIVLVLALHPISRFSLAFGPPEYFALGLFGLAITGNLVGGNVVKGFVSVVIGLLLFVVGLDVLSGYPRLTFGSTELLEGFELVPALIGFFAISEVLRLIQAPENRPPVKQHVSGRLISWRDLKALTPSILRGSAIGTAVGAVPGAGATVASLMAWNEEKRASRTPELFGTGMPEGVAAPESANNAAVGGAMIPLLTLGIPGSGSTAVMLGALMLHGINPGPLLVVEEPSLIYAIFAGLFLSAFSMLAIGQFGVPLWLKIVSIRTSTLVPVILGISVVGSYALGSNLFDVGASFFFGVLGLVMLRYGFPLVPAILGMVLGFMIESNYRRALGLSGGDHMIFLRNPISAVLLLLAVASFAIPLLRPHLPALRRLVRRPAAGLAR